LVTLATIDFVQVGPALGIYKVSVAKLKKLIQFFRIEIRISSGYYVHDTHDPPPEQPVDIIDVKPISASNPFEVC